MLQADRYAKIYEIIKEKRSVTVPYLTKQLYVSEATIRRDLENMEKQNLIKRTWGGAMIPSLERDYPPFVREQTNIEAKEKIAKIASRFLTNSCSIFMESSSTNIPLIPYIKNLKNIALITSSLRISRIAAENTSASIYLLGGQVYDGAILTGIQAVESVKQYHTDIMFFSCSGISASAGITSIEPKVLAVSQEMMKHTKKKILLCDTSKVGKDALLTLADLTVPDYVIMERTPADTELINALGDRLLTK
ncbi:MAG: DeoR/GlpR family DNA-binding transcription regulator [Lachnospiraceae bacterium]|nr:DeoR/GlpR family DNA-binding transcription regulator [Lachnospiraceae bacterium]